MDSGRAASAPQARRWPSMLRNLLPRRVAATSQPLHCEGTPLPTDPPPPPGAAPTTEARQDGDPPLPFEMFSKEWQAIQQQDNWDGFRIEGATQVTKHMQVAHSLFLGTQMRQEGFIYQFGPMFQSEDQRTFMMAKVGLDGGVNGRLVKKVGTGWELKGSINSHLTDPQRNMNELALDYAGSDWTGGAKLAWQGTMIAATSFTQKVLPSLQLGGDLTFIAMGGISTLGTLGLRWGSGRDIFTAAVSRNFDPKNPGGAQVHECRLQFARKCSERLTLGSEFKFSQDMESGMTMGYEYTFRTARVQGMLDTDGKVSCSVSDFQGFGFSGMIDYSAGNYKFGMLLHVMPQPEQPPQ